MSAGKVAKYDKLTPHDYIDALERAAARKSDGHTVDTGLRMWGHCSLAVGGYRGHAQRRSGRRRGYVEKQ